MIKIRVPATTANLGPGFDCLGLALKLYLNLEIEEIEKGLVIEYRGEGAEKFLAKKKEDTLIWKSINLVLKRANKDCLLYTSPSPRDGLLSRMPSSA